MKNESGEKQRLTLQDYKEKIAADTIYKRWENIVNEFRGTDEYDEYMEKVAEEILVDVAKSNASQSLPIQNPDKEHFDKQLLKELVWKLDLEIWAHVENPDPSEPWTQSKAREESRKLIAEYIGDYDAVKSQSLPIREKPLQFKNEEIHRWFQTKRFQRERGDQEYWLVYEIDIPKIINAFLEDHKLHIFESVPTRL